MTELTTKWRKIFDEISTADTHIKGSVNYYNLASILEDLYIENAELKARVEKLEKDTQPWTHPESGLASNIGSNLLDTFHNIAINSKKEKND